MLIENLRKPGGVPSDTNKPFIPLVLLIISTGFPSRAKSLATLDLNDRKVLLSFLAIVEFFNRLASSADNSIVIT